LGTETRTSAGNPPTKQQIFYIKQDETTNYYNETTICASIGESGERAIALSFDSNTRVVSAWMARTNSGFDSLMDRSGNTIRTLSLFCKIEYDATRRVFTSFSEVLPYTFATNVVSASMPSADLIQETQTYHMILCEYIATEKEYGIKASIIVYDLLSTQQFVFSLGKVTTCPNEISVEANDRIAPMLHLIGDKDKRLVHLYSLDWNTKNLTKLTQFAHPTLPKFANYGRSASIYDDLIWITSTSNTDTDFSEEAQAAVTGYMYSTKNYKMINAIPNLNIPLVGVDGVGNDTTGTKGVVVDDLIAFYLNGRVLWIFKDTQHNVNAFAQANCTLGTQFQQFNRSCNACPAGQFKSNQQHALSSCVLCPYGTYTASKGSKSSVECIACNNSSTSAVVCPDGSRSPLPIPMSQGKEAKKIQCSNPEYSASNDISIEASFYIRSWLEIVIGIVAVIAIVMTPALIPIINRIPILKHMQVIYTRFVLSIRVFEADEDSGLFHKLLVAAVSITYIVLYIALIVFFVNGMYAKFVNINTI